MPRSKLSMCSRDRSPCRRHRVDRRLGPGPRDWGDRAQRRLERREEAPAHRARVFLRPPRYAELLLLVVAGAGCRQYRPRSTWWRRKSVFDRGTLCSAYAKPFDLFARATKLEIGAPSGTSFGTGWSWASRPAKGHENRGDWTECGAGSGEIEMNHGAIEAEQLCDPERA
jgi:hypothetical protein